MRVSDLVRDRRTVAVAVGAEVVNVTYAPSYHTPALAERLSVLSASTDKPQWMLEFLAAALREWDVTDDAGAPYPITLESLMALPTVFLWAVLAAVLTDLRGAADDPKGSGAGSSRKAKSARRRSGTG